MDAMSMTWMIWHNVIWSGKVQCARRLQAAPKKVGIIAKLSRGFEDVGRKGVQHYNATGGPH